MNDYKTQKDLVREYMLRHGSITTAECYEKLGITRLAAAIFLLKKDGYEIGKRGVAKGKRGKYYEEFWIEKEPKNA